jgi:hypothetical protein
MRKYTLLVSIVVHAACVCAALIIPIMATHAAPRPLERIRVVLAEPALPAAPRVRPLARQGRHASMNRRACTTAFPASSTQS